MKSIIRGVAVILVTGVLGGCVYPYDGAVVAPVGGYYYPVHGYYYHGGYYHHRYYHGGYYHYYR